MQFALFFVTKFISGKHFTNIYAPFLSFKKVLNLSQLHEYYLYLYHKSDIKLDLNYISAVIKFSEIQNSIQFGNESMSRSLKSEILHLVLTARYVLDYDLQKYSRIKK